MPRLALPRHAISLAATAFALLAFLAAAPAASAAGDASGATLFQQTCAICHGLEGKGDGPAAAALTPKAADLTDHARMKELSDEHVLKVIKFGGASVGKSPLMPPVAASFSEEQLKSLLLYVRSLHESITTPNSTK